MAASTQMWLQPLQLHFLFPLQVAECQGPKRSTRTACWGFQTGSWEAPGQDLWKKWQWRWALQKERTKMWHPRGCERLQGTSKLRGVARAVELQLPRYSGGKPRRATNARREGNSCQKELVSLELVWYVNLLVRTSPLASVTGLPAMCWSMDPGMRFSMSLPGSPSCRRPPCQSSLLSKAPSPASSSSATSRFLCSPSSPVV